MSVEGHNSIHHHFWRLRNTELNKIYFFMSSRSFVLSMIAIFVPIYLLTLGYDFRVVLYYHLILHGGALLLDYPVTQIIKRYGVHLLVAISAPVLIIHLVLIGSISYFGISYIWAAVLGAFEIALFWQPYHLDFVRAKTNAKASRQVAVLVIIVAILTAFGPWIGGYLTAKFGFMALTILGSLILVPATLVFVFSRDKEENLKISFNFKNFKLKKVRRDLVANFGFAWDEMAATVFWPLFIALILKSYEAVGAVTSIGLILTVVITYLVGRKSDQGYRKRYIKMGDYSASGLHILQAFVQNFTHVFFANILVSFTRSLKNAPFTSEFYLRAGETDPGPYVFWMEVACLFSKFVMTSILLLLSIWFDIKTVLICCFVLAAVGAVMATIIPPTKQDRIELRNAKIKLMPRPKMT